MNSEIVNRISENIQKYSFLRDLYLEYSQKKLSPYFVHCEFINQKAVELKFPTEQLEIFVKDLNHIQKQEYFELRNSGNSFCLYLAVLGGNVKKLSIYKPPFDFDIDLHLAHLDSLLLCPNLPSKFYKIFANCKINHLEVYTKNCTIEQLTDLNKILLTVDSVKFSKSITRDFGDIVRIPENVKQLEFYKLNNSKELTMDYSIVKLLENLGKLELKFNHCDLTPQEMDVLKGFLESRRCTSFTFQIDENSINHLESLCLDSILKFAICPRLSVNVPFDFKLIKAIDMLGN
ncbi:hypothetical protein HK103_002158 [Boothiomyces macroporosus]|uniref:Uncharacterized protein n=1 Tax=Boothiomyces macroporosus TaxID=261099 RepID=A0AAD5UJ51_9FUNG|nr:hypothetical protein HK103_002158 [Boothiomyces macroporosus]